MSKIKHKEQKNKSTHKRFKKIIDEYKSVSHHFQSEIDIDKIDMYEVDMYESDMNEADISEVDINEIDINKADINEADINEVDINDQLPNYISASLTLPELPQVPAESLIDFSVDIIIGEGDHKSNKNIVYFRLMLINNENNNHWCFCILANNEEFDPQNMTILNPSESLKIVFQADEKSSTSKEADNCMNWNAHIEANNQSLLEKQLILTSPPSVSLKCINIVAFIFNVEGNNILSKKQIDFHNISFKSFSGKDLTKNWELSGSQNGKPDHLDILTKAHSSTVSIVFP